MPDRGADEQPADDERKARPARRSRRATTPPPAGSDPTPLPEPPRSSGTENDERMRAEKPPHY